MSALDYHYVMSGKLNTAKRNAFLKKHAITKHEGVRYSCDYCTHKSTDEVTLKQYIKSQHEGKRYPCKDCK